MGLFKKKEENGYPINFSRALIATGIIFTGADGDVSDPELNHLNTIVDEHQVPADVFNDLMKRLNSNLKTADARLDFLSDITASLTALEKEQVLRFACRVLISDRAVKTKEQAMLDKLASILGIPFDHVTTLFAEERADFEGK